MCSSFLRPWQWKQSSIWRYWLQVPDAAVIKVTLWRMQRWFVIAWNLFGLRMNADNRLIFCMNIVIMCININTNSIVFVSLKLQKGLQENFYIIFKNFLTFLICAMWIVHNNCSAELGICCESRNPSVRLLPHPFAEYIKCPRIIFILSLPPL
jgi:hypothetical protein